MEECVYGYNSLSHCESCKVRYCVVIQQVRRDNLDSLLKRGVLMHIRTARKPTWSRGDKFMLHARQEHGYGGRSRLEAIDIRDLL